MQFQVTVPSPFEFADQEVEDIRHALRDLDVEVKVNAGDEELTEFEVTLDAEPEAGVDAIVAAMTTADLPSTVKCGEIEKNSQCIVYSPKN